MFLAWLATEKRVGVPADAYTVGMAGGFKTAGRWSTKPGVGAIVFFDWQGGKSLGGIDHVGIVEKINPNDSITAIEGNKDDAVKRVKRAGQIVGYGLPAYTK